MARGFYWSILFMLSVPGLIAAGFAGAMFLSYRKWRKGRSAPQPQAEAS